MKENTGNGSGGCMLSAVHRVADHLRQKIFVGEFAVGDRLANERDLAAGLGVSRGTLRQALSLLQRERLIVRQHGRGSFVADPAYAAVEAERGAMLGMMVYEREYFFESVVRAALTKAGEMGYVLGLGSNATPEEEQTHARAFLSNGIKGAVIAPRPGRGSATYQSFVDQGVPVVIVDAILPEVYEDYVGCDEARGTRLAAAHLAELGHRRLGYICTPSKGNLPFGPERRRGFHEGCAEAGIPFDLQRIVEVNERNYAAVLNEMLAAPDRPSGFVCYSDMWALRLLDAAAATGLSVSEDLSVVGFDDSAAGQTAATPLTSVNPNQAEMGRTAVELLVQKITAEPTRARRSILVTPHLAVRASTGPVRND